MAQSKFYVVWAGRQPGIYTSWPDCQRQVSGFPQAKYKSYESEAEAKRAYERGWQRSLDFSGKGKAGGRTSQVSAASPPEEVDLDSISVDVGCSGNPGIVEYKGVDTRTGEVLFYKGPISKGTNNLGEFLAIVHGLGYLQQLGSSKTIYTDSVTALSWIRKKEVSTNLVRGAALASHEYVYEPDCEVGYAAVGRDSGGFWPQITARLTASGA